MSQQPAAAAFPPAADAPEASPAAAVPAQERRAFTSPAANTKPPVPQVPAPDNSAENDNNEKAPVDDMPF